MTAVIALEFSAGGLKATSAGIFLLKHSICLKVIEIIIIVPRTAFVYLALYEEYHYNSEKDKQNDTDYLQHLMPPFRFSFHV